MHIAHVESLLAILRYIFAERHGKIITPIYPYNKFDIHDF